MSFKKTLFETSCCHIYETSTYEDDKHIDVLRFNVCYELEGDGSFIEVDSDLDFAFLIKNILLEFDVDKIDNILRKIHIKKIIGGK